MDTPETEGDLSIFDQVKTEKNKAPKKNKSDEEREAMLDRMQRRYLWEMSFTRIR